MNRTTREIRRAFENITPNVLDRVLSQSSLKKGAVTPMKEKKPFIPYAIQKIASAAAVVVLLVAIGIVALMILNGRTNPQLSDNPTEPPTEAPTDPVVIPEGPASQEKAIAYMKLHVKNPDRYELIDYTYQEHIDKYEAMFVYRVYGISTSDYCRVVMCSDGKLDHCSAPNEGIFDNIQITPEMLQSADERLYNMYYGLSKDSYTIEDRCIIMDAGVVSVEYVLDPPEPATFLETYAVPLIQGEVAYDEETALAWAKKYFRVAEARLFLDVKCELSDDKNFVHYDVSFRVNGYRYSCEVGRFTGEVWNAERVRAERWDSNSDAPPPISAELATKFVFEFLNIDQTQVKELKVELITNDDAPHYKITFLHNGKEYEWEIDVDTGGWQFRTQN